MKNSSLDIKKIIPVLTDNAQKAVQYAGFLFFVLVAAIYIFMLLRINTLTNAQPTETDIVNQSTTKRLNVDKSFVRQLEQLEDNSVNVQALFDEARNNPFQE